MIVIVAKQRLQLLSVNKSMFGAVVGLFRREWPLLARDNMLSALYMLSPVHRSVCLSIRHTCGSVKKWLKLGLRNFQHTIPLVFASYKFHPEILILTGSPDRAVKQGRGVENKPSEILGSILLWSRV